ncbi:MAG: DNA-directed RNA polymerase subunit omega [Planctomycetaceae bacterium]|jgi:DNA-directed RNA polymerase subunit omega|nr:DNA-directed RNA polymerase subunit omega [Planctomycetaceae bacterium]
MIEELKDEELIKKVGGRFKLSSLIQKRLVYLNKGAQAFVDTDKSKSKDKLHIVIKEILQDKIYLDMEGNLQERQPSAVDIVFDSEYTET